MNLNLSVIMTIEDFLSGAGFTAIIKKKNCENRFELPEGRTYSIPAYQREIRWKAKNMSLLFDNVNDDEIFLGNILISKKNEREYDVIDGQQRFTAIMLLMKALEKYGNVTLPTLVNYNNKSIEKFDDMLSAGFDDEVLRKRSDYEDIISTDLLDQRESLKGLWDEANNCINSKLKISEHNKFLKRLLQSNINVIMSEETGGIFSDSICVDYYIDINDKAVALDSIDIMKAQLFKKDFDSMTKRWEEIQKSLKKMRMNGAKYSYNDFYFHYFACTINPYYEYKLKSLNRTLKTLSRVTVRKEEIPVGSHIIEASLDSKISENSMDGIEKCATFFAYVMSTGGNFENAFLEYFGKKPSNETARIIFHIIYSLLKMDNEVPKILLTKYYLDVVLSGNSDMYDVIFDIYVSTILFNVVPTMKKSSTKFVGIVLQKKWIQELRKYALDKYRTELTQIAYDKAIKDGGKVTKTSGQFIPKHIFAIRQFLDAQMGVQGIRCLNKHFLSLYLDESEMTAEHFFINQSYEFTFKYGPNNELGKIKCPAGLKKYISCPVNYLYIKKLDNAAFGNAVIQEKIDYLKNKDESVFASTLIYAAFLKAQEIFDDGAFPDLSQIQKKSAAERAVRKYYREEFPKRIQKYIAELAKISVSYDKTNIAKPWSI